MPPVLSVYLDLIRFLAAVVVVLAHLAERFFPGIPLPFPGKDAVIAFFVLSGFVVSYVADTRERHWADFAISRFSRLVCVFYPALMLSVAIAPLVAHPGWRSWRDAAGIVPGIGLNTAFLGQVWFLNITPPNNDPSWSLDYEAWYYLIFAVATYVKGTARWPLAALAALCAGPKILILMPCWIAGCLLYRYGARLTVRAPAATIMFLASIGLYAMYFITDLNVLIRGALQHAIPSVMLHLQWSNRFAGDYILCGIVCMNFVAARSMENAFTRALLRHGRLIRGGAAYTLSIYLYHAPLMAAFGASLDPVQFGRARGLIVAALLVPSIGLLASVTELRLHSFRALLRQRLLGREAPLPKMPRPTVRLTEARIRGEQP